MPDPLEFARGRLGGTLQGGAGRSAAEVDFSAWAPLLKQLLSTPNAGGTLTRAYIERLSQLARRPISRSAAIDMTEMDDVVEAILG